MPWHTNGGSRRMATQMEEAGAKPSTAFPMTSQYDIVQIFVKTLSLGFCDLCFTFIDFQTAFHGAVEESATKRAHEPRAQWSTCHQQNRTAMIHQSQQIRSANSGLFFKMATFPLRRSPFFKLGTCLHLYMRGLASRKILAA